MLGYFWARILKNHSHISNQHPEICIFTKFCKETKVPYLAICELQF